LSDYNSVNKVILVGHVTKSAPELKHTKQNISVCTFNIATNERFKKGEETLSSVVYHRIVVWAKKAEFCAKYLMKGSMVSVIGRLRTKIWKDGEGKTVRLTEVQAEEITMLGKRLEKEEEVKEETTVAEREPGEDEEDPF